MKGLRFIWHMEITEKMLTTCSCTCFADLDECVHKVRPLGTFLSLFLCGTKAPPMVFIGWNSVRHSYDKTSMGWVDVGRMWGELGPPFPLCLGPPRPGGSGAPGAPKSWCIALSPLWLPARLLPLPLGR